MSICKYASIYTVGTPFLTPRIFPLVTLPSLRAKIRSTYKINGTIDGDVVSFFKVFINKWVIVHVAYMTIKFMTSLIGEDQCY